MTRPGFLARTGPRAVVRTVFMAAALIVGEDAATAADTPQTLIDRMASERRDGRLNDAVETAHIAWDEVQREGRIDGPEGERLRGELRELAEALRASIDIPVVLSFENGNVQSASPIREERVDAAPQPDVAGDDLATESRLTVTGVQVEPERVVQGQAFRVAVDLVASGPSGGSVSVTFDISIVRSGQALATTTLTAEAPSGRVWRLTKEVPRAAGDPGRYTVQVETRAGLASSSGSAGLEIVAP
jgi:hypothetical protein